VPFYFYTAHAVRFVRIIAADLPSIIIDIVNVKISYFLYS